MIRLRFSKTFASICIFLLLGVHSLQNAAADETVWAVTDDQFLISWDSTSPNDLTFGTAISGLQINEQILGIDFRPDDGQIFAVGSSNRLYTIGMDGSATQVGPSFNIPLDGSAFGYDFNPTIDRSRIDTNTNNNYVVNPNDGLITQVNDVFYSIGDANEGVDPNIAHIAYTNSFPGALSTQLYAIDVGLDTLVTQANSAGTLGTVGSLGLDINEIGGFDISGTSGWAYGAFQTTSKSTSHFYTLDLTTGSAKLLGEIGGGTTITALTVQSSAIPEPSTFAVFSMAVGFAISRRRR